VVGRQPPTPGDRMRWTLDIGPWGREGCYSSRHDELMVQVYAVLRPDGRATWRCEVQPCEEPNHQWFSGTNGAITKARPCCLVALVERPRAAGL
jgi:hypothetical protein